MLKKYELLSFDMVDAKAERKQNFCKKNSCYLFVLKVTQTRLDFSRHSTWQQNEIDTFRFQE